MDILLIDYENHELGRKHIKKVKFQALKFCKTIKANTNDISNEIYNL